MDFCLATASAGKFPETIIYSIQNKLPVDIKTPANITESQFTPPQIIELASKKQKASITFDNIASSVKNADQRKKVSILSDAVINLVKSTINIQ